MKKWALYLLVFAVSIVGCARSHVLRQSYPPGNMLHISQFNKLETPAQLNNSVIYFNSGDTIPLKLTLENDFIGLRQPEVELVLKQDLYFRVQVPPDMTTERFKKLGDLDPARRNAMDETERQALFDGITLYAGRDGVNWAPINDISALNEVFGIKGGSVAFGLGVSRQDGAWASLTVAARRQTP